MKRDDILIRLREWEARLSKPSIGCTSGEFNQRSYARSAASEAIRMIENSDNPPNEVIEQFIYRLNQYACTEHEYSFAFSIAYDTVTAMYDEVILK